MKIEDKRWNFADVLNWAKNAQTFFPELLFFLKLETHKFYNSDSQISFNVKYTK